MNLYSADGIDAASYSAHVSEKLVRFQGFIAATEFSAILISSGQTKIRFADDMAFPFQASSYFREWLPLGQRENCFLLIPAEGRPTLLLDVAEDIWHSAPQSLPDDWHAAFETLEFSSREQLNAELKSTLGGVAYIGEANEFALPEKQINPKSLLQQIDYCRRFKTGYEHACIRQANKYAAVAHQAAEQAFYAAGSELEIKLAYLSACAQADAEMPYGIIAGLNEHAAVLHHFMLDNVAPSVHRSFLIDAGIDINGYASDITRTYSFDRNDDFSAMIAALDTRQQEMCQFVSVGDSTITLHEFSHLKVAEVLAEFKIIHCTPEAAVTTGITGSFYPHGVGHGLGVNVHELGGQLADPQGTLIEPPAAYPRLRNTVDFAATAVHTVEPGLYFIPALLGPLKESANSKDINWGVVNDFLPFGGIRIEDDVLVLADGGVENFTRAAFTQLGR